MKKYLLTPGPSYVPYRIREELAKEIIHHRTQEFREILKEVSQSLKKVFCTENPVITFASSGTGAMEAAVANFFSLKDKVIVVNGGKFGERWKEITQGYGLEVVEYKIEWGSFPSVEYLDNLLKKEKDIKALFTTLCETSTGTVYNIEEIAKLVKDKSTLLIVDAVSGLGQDKLLTDEWGVDVVVSSSQKGLMLPPGLSFISISPKAQEAMKKAKLPCYYFNLAKALKSYKNDDTPFTSSISLIVALRKSLEIINEEGIANRWKRFSLLSSATREAAKSLGLSLFSKRPSNSVTAISSPQGISSSEVVNLLRKKYKVSIAGGQAEFKEKIFRIAHMGAIDKDDLLVCFSFLEKALKELGYKRFEEGISLKKLQEILDV
ncbi:MAG: aminotransferase [Candidatus Omnitrophota bacterium]|nr:MAG: aminotransferase [Candidatus Omnitrophota bacterium]